MGRQLDNFEIEACARAAHEVNRQFCSAMGDFSHGPWETLTDDLKSVARESVINIATHDHTNKQLHDSWVAAKRSQGWSYAPTKDTKAKEHPCLVAWDQLPFEQQVKDDLWISTVKSLVAAFYRIPRQ